MCFQGTRKKKKKVQENSLIFNIFSCGLLNEGKIVKDLKDYNCFFFF